ncbi:L-aminoadipate-semialdehyde dehydrogenase-phosphopantetheinyl transferase isoform X3 [Octopus bimaculoides]|uniref:holo-[acyl-carrier-protein] synthase n=1 Tax=Octopus bimaculoides TaxID=37653 RepID=A0A0L8GBP2_OCTBM|nr:L-aminoadipate-semialdehyde dehydrogenase-phosphopantetheinyl transferase isoform X3 [Octopus bimaculoides]|eukprot:XP_014782402.1 PREDICTED: L-aminoadipate-semialdehyde dehydrogenase-phosphopantetheinyl transferase-like isoform X3 [Octopus bimaculoides]
MYNFDKLWYFNTNLMKKFMAGLRLAFNFGLWNPLQSEWTFAAQCIQPEEKERISQFMFQKDAKAAMAGRLLIRKSLSSLLQVPYSSLVLSRTDKGKPYLSSVGNAFSKTSPHFNIAHHGNFTVLATHPNVDIGVDIMKVEQPMGRTVKKFFHDMRRQFTELEWGVIQSTGSEFNQLLMFYRHWESQQSLVEASTIKPFRILSFQELIANAKPQTPADLEYWQNFDSKLERPKKQQESVT